MWWSDALDRWLADPARWDRAMVEAVVRAARETPAPWGEAQRLTLRNLVLGGLGLGFDAGPYPLAGSMATVCQGNLLNLGGQPVAIGPAYRFLTDLGEDYALTSLPGGIDGSRFSRTYTCWLDDHLAGRYHRLAPPS